MPFVPDTATTDAPPRRGGFVPDAPPPAAPAPPPAPAVPIGQLGAAAVPGMDPEWVAGRAPEQVADRQRREAAARNPIRDKVVGAVEGALDVAAKIVGGTVGGVGGLWYGVLTGEGKNAPEKMVEGAQRGVGVVRDIYRQTRLTSGGEPETETGRALSGLVDKAAEVFPSVGTGPRGTLVNSLPEGAVSTAVRGARDIARAAGDAAMEAATPRMSQRSMELVGKATDAGVPINFHQLSDNKFMKIIGETAENVPLAGGGSLRAKRREAFNLALAKQMDPETDITVLDDASFKQLQDAAGERIGEISSKYQVPAADFGDLMTLDRARRGTPDTKAVVQAWAEDLKKIAEENGGFVPGDTLRRLRTEVQTQAREMRANKADVAAVLDDVVHRFDDALANVAADADVAALTDARRRYAISKVLEPLVARHPDGNFAPSALKSIMAQKSGGKQRRMARGEAGELGEYARIGQELLKELPSSGTAERNLVYSGVGAGAGAGAAFAEPLSAAAIYAGSAIYNLVGPRVVKRLVDAQRRRDAPTPEGRPPEPTLGRGFEDVSQRPEPGGEAPLGDLTPEWGTTPGAAPAAAGGMDPAGLVPALGEEAPSTGTRVDMRTRAGQEIPAVPGRPDLPDTLVSGAPAESAATEPANAAMVTPGAIEARRQQGMAAVERAAAAERAEPVPVGEATEITPESVKPAPGMPDEPIPVGEATEITPENVKPAPEVKEHPEVAKIRQDIAKKREAEAKKQAAADELRAAAAAETDPEVKAALIKRADAIAPAKKQEKTDGTPSEPVGTGGVRKEAGQEGVQEGGDAGAQAAKGGEESLSIDPSVTETPAFKRWFGDSKVVDVEGKPLVVYHGTNKDLTKFKPGRGGGAIWFAQDPSLANLFVAGGRRAMGEGVKKGSTVYPVHLSLKNPLDLGKAAPQDTLSVADVLQIANLPSDDAALAKIAQANLDSKYAFVSPGTGDPVQYLVRQYRSRARASNTLDDPGLMSALRAGGFDGLKMTEEGSVTYAAFSPEQIKSATGNRGTFNPRDPNISNDLSFPKIEEGLLDLQQRAVERVSPPPAPSPRGRRQVRRALERGMADGTLNKDGASLALWALDRNENLAHGLRVEVLQPEPGSPAKGSYDSATRIVELFQGNDNPETAMHEILHHSERMMPDAVQQGIYRAWERAVKAEMEGASPERTKAMEALNRASSGDKAALTEAKQAFDSGVLSEDDYQYVNPTEYWAVNGARIMHERFTGRGSWRAQARQWMREMIEHVKGTVGIRSDSPLLKTLNEMLDPAKTTGAQKSPTMIKNRPEGGGSLTSDKTPK